MIYGYWRVSSDDQDINPQRQVFVAFAFGVAAEIEQQMICQCTREGLPVKFAKMINF